jgi:predicted metalloprotease
MRWQGGRESENVEDRRGAPARAMIGGGIGTLVIIVLGLVFGFDPRALLQLVPQAPPAPAGANADPNRPIDPAQEERKKFVSVVLASTEDVWDQVFREMGQTYQKPTLVLFSDRVESACGLADSAVGPFYCPLDKKVFLDLSFFEELSQKYRAPGEFAQAYVVAHEIGHHVQNLLGVSDQVQQLQQRARGKAEANRYSVMLELQADFLAGVWANHANRTRSWLEEGDVESALRAATAIGDDRLQKQAQGYVVPDSFTHGSSEQRVKWFVKGLRSGRVEDGDTFNEPDL